MLETGQQIKSKTSRTGPLLIAAVVAAAIGIFAYLEWKQRSDAPPTEIVLTDEARAYLPKLDLSGVEMSAMDNSLGQTLVEITGTITNTGDRHVRSIRLNCVFFDVYGLEHHRVLSTIVRARNGLEPGSTSEFRLPFDDIPEGWNQVMPSLYIAEIVFD